MQDSHHRNRGLSSLIWLFLDPWVIGGAIAFGMLLLITTLLLTWLTRPTPTPAAPPTAVLNIILAPTDTPTPITPTPQGSPTPTSLIPPSPLPGSISVGAYVQISGTGGDGLRLRAEAGLKNEVRLLGAEAEVFQVKDGPKEADGFTWWYLVGLYDAKRSGWAVANYLSAVQKP